MLRIAVPNKGSLAETSAAMLTEAGYTGRRDPKDLHVIDPANEVEFFYLRPRDIATYVGSGALDVGITGRDLLLTPACRHARWNPWASPTPPSASRGLRDVSRIWPT